MSGKCRVCRLTSCATSFKYHLWVLHPKKRQRNDRILLKARTHKQSGQHQKFDIPQTTIFDSVATVTRVKYEQGNRLWQINMRNLIQYLLIDITIYKSFCTESIIHNKNYKRAKYSWSAYLH